MTAYPARHTISVIKIDAERFAVGNIRERLFHRSAAISQRGIRGGTICAHDDVCARPSNQLLNRWSEDALGTHFGSNLRRRKVFLLDLYACVRSRNEPADFGIGRKRNTNVDTAVRCCLAAAPRYKRSAQAPATKFRLAEASDENAEIFVGQSCNIIRGNIKHKAWTALDLRMKYSELLSAWNVGRPPRHGRS